MRVFTTPVLAMALLVSSTAAAQDIGTWSAQRSPYPIATSDAFDSLRARVQRDFPDARFVALHSLPAAVLSQIDLLILDGQGTTPLDAAEKEALRAYVEAGGVLLAQGLGPTGRSIGEAFGVSASSVHDGEAPRVDAVPAGFCGGPFGAVTRFGNRYEGHLSTTRAGAAAVGDANGAHLLSMDVGEGRVVFFGNLFAFADPDFKPGGLFGAPNNDNATLVSNLIARAMPAPRIGTWSTSRSEVGFARSNAFDAARSRILATLPGTEFVALDRLDPVGLEGLDVLVLDSTIKQPLTISEFDALSGYVHGGGAVVAHLYGPTGNAIAGLYGLAVKGSADPAVRSYVVPADVGSPVSGPFGSVSTFENRYEVTIVGKGAANDGIPLASDTSGARVVYVPRTPKHGSALLLTNLFAFGDPDWSAGGLAQGENDNLTLLGNFFSAVGTAVQASASGGHVDAFEVETPAWLSDYRSAALAAARGDLKPLDAWISRYRDDPASSGLVIRSAAWIASPEREVDPRFFPIDGITLGESSRRDLLAAQHSPNDVSKWTFDVGGLGWTCLEGKKDLCYEVRAADRLPDAWSATGLGLELPPEQLSERFASLGYATTIGVASTSPFGRQVVARGFGVLWQADYSHQYQGEELLSLTARRVAR